MTAGQKVSVSLLVSVLLFAGFTVLAYTGLFDLVEARFYNPAVSRGLEKELAGVADSTDAFFEELRSRFQATLLEASIQQSFLPNQSSEDIFERSRIFGLLNESLPSFISARFIDSNGRRIHYSTDARDILRQDRLSIAWRNYGDRDDELPWSRIERDEGSEALVFVDGQREQLVFSYPFSDSFNVHKGTAVFVLSVRALQEALVRESRIKAGESLFVIDNPDGAVIALPGSRLPEDLRGEIRAHWESGARGAASLASGESGIAFNILSSSTREGFMIARVYEAGIFSFPRAMKYILLASFFLTVFLLIFLLFNLRQDKLTLASERIKRLQIAILEECYSAKGDFDWAKWTRELELRRDEVRREIKRSLPKTPNIDELVDKSWDELLQAMGAVRPLASNQLSLDESRLQTLIEKIPSLQTSGTSERTRASKALEEAKELEEVEALEEVEELEEVEALEEVEELEEVEALEEVEELEEVEALEEVEELEESSLMDDEILEELEASETADGGLSFDAEESFNDSTSSLDPPSSGGIFRSSGIRIVFGEDDDIPCIEEASSIELVDDFVSQPFDDEAAELEELDDEDEGAGELEELEEPDTVSEGPANDPRAAMDAILSRIEFSETEKQIEETGDLEDPLTALDIVSPFDSMLEDFFSFEPEVPKDMDELTVQVDWDDDEPSDLEPVDLVAPYIPHFNTEVSFELLPAVGDDYEEPVCELEDLGESVISETDDGLILINVDAGSGEAALDNGFKALVDSVIESPQKIQRRR